MNDITYVQLTNSLKQEIMYGMYRNERKLPEQDVLAAKCGVTEKILMQAMDVLEQEGYITRRQVIETFINRPTKDKVSVLIVEDDPQLSVKLKEIISLEGYDTTLARDGNQAVLEFNRQKYALVFLDLRLPGLNGVGVLKSIRHTNPRIKVVVIAGHPEDILVVDKGDVMPQMVIPKPFRLSQIREALGLINKN